MKTEYLPTNTELSRTRLCELLRNFRRVAISYRCKSTSLRVNNVQISALVSTHSVSTAVVLKTNLA